MRKGFIVCLVMLLVSISGVGLSRSEDTSPDLPFGGLRLSSDSASAVAATSQADESESEFRSTSRMSNEELQGRLADLDAEVASTIRIKASDDVTIERVKVEVAGIKEETQAISEGVADRAVAIYVNANAVESKLKFENLNDEIRAVTLGNAATLADQDAIDAYQVKNKDLEIAELRLQRRVERNSSLEEQIESLLSKRDAYLDEVVEREEVELYLGAEQSASAASTRAQGQGKKQGLYLTTCPVAGDHYFIDSWGFPRSGGRTHKGVDILADIGVPVVAPADGRVEHSSNSIGGRSFRLYDNNGNYYYGTHLSAYGASGEVRAGQIIGYVGDDGNAAGIPHLHFEIHPGGKGNQINPFIDSAAVCEGADYL